MVKKFLVCKLTSSAKSNFLYHGKTWNGNTYMYINVKKRWHLIRKFFCHLNTLQQFLAFNFDRIKFITFRNGYRLPIPDLAPSDPQLPLWQWGAGKRRKPHFCYEVLDHLGHPVRNHFRSTVVSIPVFEAFHIYRKRHLPEQLGTIRLV